MEGRFKASFTRNGDRTCVKHVPADERLLLESKGQRKPKVASLCQAQQQNQTTVFEARLTDRLLGMLGERVGEFDVCETKRTLASAAIHGK